MQPAAEVNQKHQPSRFNDFTRASEVTSEVSKAIDDAFEYHPWNSEQVEKGASVRNVLATAVRVIIELVPPSPDRSAAIRKIREARMDCNSAITHNGRYYAAAAFLLPA